MHQVITNKDNFIFEDIDRKTGYALKLGKYRYYFDFPEISFKTKYELELIPNAFPYILKSRKYTYVIDFSGAVLFKTTHDRLEQNLKEWNLTYEEYKYQEENLPFDAAKYEYVSPSFDWNNKKFYPL